MNPILANRSEKKFYQLLTIDNLVFSQISGKLSASGIKLKLVLSDLTALYLVEAPTELGMLLRKSKGYELHTFNNDDFVLLIKYLTNTGATIEEIEFLGENYFEEDLNEELKEKINLKNYSELLSIIKNHSLKVTKFTVKKCKNTIFYRSGLIYSDESLHNLSELLRSFFEER
jgi:hypothetical protein